MAFVAAGNSSGFFVTFIMIDRNEDVTTKEYELDAADFTIASGIATEMRGDLELVSDCEIIGQHISHRLVEDAVVVPSVGEAQVKARLVVRLDGGQGKATIDIPAPKESLFMALTGKANKVVDVNNVDLLDFLANFETGAAAPAFLSDGEKMAVGGLIEGRKVTSRSGLRSS